MGKKCMASSADKTMFKEKIAINTMTEHQGPIINDMESLKCTITIYAKMKYLGNCI